MVESVEERIAITKIMILHQFKNLGVLFFLLAKERKTMIRFEFIPSGSGGIGIRATLRW